MRRAKNYTLIKEKVLAAAESHLKKTNAGLKLGENPSDGIVLGSASNTLQRQAHFNKFDCHQPASLNSPPHMEDSWGPAAAANWVELQRVALLD